MSTGGIKTPVYETGVFKFVPTLGISNEMHSSSSEYVQPNS